MSRECEVCGRRIKTGRKYCYEHRNSSASGYSSMNNLERDYIHTKVPSNTKVTILSVLLAVIWLFIIGFLAEKQIISEGKALLCLFVGFIGIPFIGILILKIKTYFAQEDIYKRNERFTEFARMYSKIKREDNEFRRSIFSK